MFWAKRYYNKQTIYEQCSRLCPHINMLKYFELRIMLTQQENLHYQVNLGLVVSEKIFFYVFPMMHLGQGPYGPQGHGWQDL